MVEESKPFNIRTRVTKTFQTRDANGRISNVEGSERIRPIAEALRLADACAYGDVVVHAYGADAIAQALKVYGIMQLKSPKKFSVIDQNGRPLDILEFNAPVDARVPDRKALPPQKEVPKKSTKAVK